MTIIGQYHLSPLDYRVVQIRTSRQGPEETATDTNFLVSPILVGHEEGDDFRRLILAGRLGWISPENHFEVGIGAMFRLTRLAGDWAPEDGDIEANDELRQMIDTFAAEEGGYLAYDFAQRQLRLICAMHEQDMEEYEEPDIDATPIGARRGRTVDEESTTGDAT